jgi:hypothetical protein
VVRQLLPVASVAAIMVIAACSTSDSIESTEPATIATVEVTTTTAPPTSTSTTTTSTTSTSTTTTSTTSTTSTSTTTSTTTPVPATVPPMPADAPATVVATDATDLIEIDVRTGAIVRTVTTDFNGGGVFRGDLRLSGDRAAIWFSEGYEDGWYGCDSSIGSIGRVDVATGAFEVLGLGTGPEPSLDGRSVAYRSSELCLPDPENPDLWVLTPYDRVVVRLLESGEELEFVTAETPDRWDSPGAVAWGGFDAGGNLLVLLADGRLFGVELDGPGVIQDHPMIVPAVIGAPVGVFGGTLFTVDLGDEGSADVYAIDLASGAADRIVASEAYLAVGLDPETGYVVVNGADEVRVTVDAPVGVLESPDGRLLYDVDW